MLTRRGGFTLVELLVSIVVLAIIGFASMRMMNGVLSTSRAQVAVATSQTNVRTGMLAFPAELREVGYDSIPDTGGVESDLLAIAAHRVTFRAMRGLGMTCGTPTQTEFRVRKPITGIREPIATDGFRLFVENDPNQSGDDQWVAMHVAAIDPNSNCSGAPAIKFTLSSVPQVDTLAGTDMQLPQYRVGGPVRWFEKMEYGPYVDPSTGLAWVGARSVSQGQVNLKPVFGPLPDTLAFALEYRDGNMGVLDPATTPPIRVRAVVATLTGTTDAPVSLAGSARRSRSLTTFTTLVALRNTLRP
jgi:prepilin-type N-terminal cleavage/methylation domain-containing protein